MHTPIGELSETAFLEAMTGMTGWAPDWQRSTGTSGQHSWYALEIAGSRGREPERYRATFVLQDDWLEVHAAQVDEEGGVIGWPGYRLWGEQMDMDELGTGKWAACLSAASCVAPGMA